MQVTFRRLRMGYRPRCGTWSATRVEPGTLRPEVPSTPDWSLSQPDGLAEELPQGLRIRYGFRGLFHLSVQPLVLEPRARDWVGYVVHFATLGQAVVLPISIGKVAVRDWYRYLRGYASVVLFSSNGLTPLKSKDSVSSGVLSV